MSTVNTPKNEAQPQRDAQGRFVNGNAGGPGNPFGRHLGRARCKWNSLATPEHVENVYKSVYEKAIGGCVAAMKLYLLYLLGKPNPMPNPDHVDLEEFELYAKATQLLKMNPDVMLSPDHRYILEVARTARPAMAEEARKNMLQTFKEKEEEEREIDEEIKQMEEEYDRQQAKKRSAAAKRAAKRGTQKQRRANVKREAAKRGARGKGRAARQTPRHELDPRLPADDRAKSWDPAVTQDPPHRAPSPSLDGFFPSPSPSSNGEFRPENDPLGDGPPSEK